MALFNRIVKVVVGQGGGKGVSVEDLRVSFSISKTGTKNPNNSDLRIWNLAPATRTDLERPDTRLVLYAGYSEQDGLIKIFEGDVTYSWTKKDGADIVTEFELGEGVKELRDSMISRTYSGAVSSKSIMAEIAAEMGLGLDVGTDIPERRWTGGLSFHGTARSAMDRVTRPDGLSWSVQGGAIQVVRSGGATQRRAIVLSTRSGLIGSPERMRKGPNEAARVMDEITNRPTRVTSQSDRYDGWRVKSLLMPIIVPNDTVRLESIAATGNFVAREVRHVGDTHDGDWQTELVLVDAETSRRLQQQDQRQAGRGG